MSSTAWQLDHVTEHYLQQVRGAIPYGADQTKIMLQVIQYLQSSPVERIMDLGCGNGFLAQCLLQAYPDASAILIDHSRPMLDNAADYMEAYSKRCEWIEADLANSLLPFGEMLSFDCIVSGYAIHHLSHARKKELYGEIFELLKPGGVFINIEHVASATPELERLYDEMFIDHLTMHNKRSRDEVAAEYYARPDKADNILEKVTTQVEWLQEIGYEHADCYFKWMELAVFGGRKPR